ncbi:hypothetical protein QBC42DRAFT_275105 [Cladorrhinum samala]|uniref:Uncharacterized protein n=1 Tax=Cladorrhinum samala TaxID=585594 RepID=A0AAV9HH54_9PEZI|nr:hypothetical protein QBC42DRAFT_275105 [Cladorrhinum samala]
MATAVREIVTLRNTRLCQAMRALLAIPSRHFLFLTGVIVVGGTTTTTTNAAAEAIPLSSNCGVVDYWFIFPPSSASQSPKVYRAHDILNVTYRSSLINPTPSLWCGERQGRGGAAAPRKASLKFRTSDASYRTGSFSVALNFNSDLPCWFELAESDEPSIDCGDANRSDSFLVLPASSPLPPPSLPLPPPPPPPPPLPLAVRQDTTTAGATIATTASSSPSVGPAATGDQPRGGGGQNNLSPGAKAAIGISVTLTVLSIVAMALFLHLRNRRRKGRDTELAGAIIDHERRSGRKGPEKRHGAPSVAASEEPLYPEIIQPVFDGFPGSMGYDDVRSLNSSLVNSHSPISGPDSPTSSNNGGFWGGSGHGRSTERDELVAARLKAQAHTAVPSVVSYGPNPVTPTLTPRPSSRVELNKRAASNSPDSIEAIPHVPHIPVSIPDYLPDFASYSIPPPSSVPSPPRKLAAPIVVSYGPNPVTPTPIVVSPTVPPDDAVISRQIQQAAAAQGGGQLQNNINFNNNHNNFNNSINTYDNNNSSSHNDNNNDNHPYRHERQFSFEAESPLLGTSHMGPLPPYASTADFEAMEKGAVRKLAEPQAEAELPPTKDGFYHGYGAALDVIEYELPGAAPQNEPQLPFQTYKPHPSGNSSGNVGGYREVDEQKFLLSDLLNEEDIRRLKEEKAKQKAERERRAKEARERGEEFDLGETMGQARERERESGRNGFLGTGMGYGMGYGMGS